MAEINEQEELLEVAETEETMDETVEDVQSESQLEMAQEEGDEPTEEIVPEEAEFVDTLQMFSILESLLFVSDKPVGVATFKSAFHGTSVNTRMIKKALQEMQSMYADPSRGVSLEEVNGGWQLRTKLDNLDFLKRVNKTRPFRLSGPALEVLSIIAYKQPLIKNEVDQIRGVESGHLVRALMEKNLVNFQGKSELPGKPMMYGTTRKFLEIFGLRNIKELPTLDEIDQLLPDGIGEEEDSETLSEVTAAMSEEGMDSYSQGEEELTQITEKLGEIDTSTEFFEDEKRRQKEKRDRERAEDIREALAVDEEVDKKDQRWLERYEAKLAEAAAEESKAQETTEVEETSLSEEPVVESEIGAEDVVVQAQSEAGPEADALDESAVEATAEQESATPAVGDEAEMAAESEEETSTVKEGVLAAASQLEELGFVDDDERDPEASL